MSDKIKNIKELRKEEKTILLTNFLRVTAFFAGFYAIVCYAIDFQAGMFVMGINFILQASNFILYKKNRISYRISSNFHLANSLFAVVGCAYFTGGLLSPSMGLIATVPVVSLLLLGSRIDTLCWTIISFVPIFIFTFLFYNQHVFPQSYDPSYEGFYFAVCWAGLLFLSYIIGFLFEKAKSKALEIVRIQNFDLTEKQDEITASNEELVQQKEELAATVEVVQYKNKVIEKQSEDVRSSIIYASRIQNALLPHTTTLEKYFNQDYFILNKPRDIVSGDFYWCEKIEDYTILVVADCTGHGVPGAFMSMLGVTSLNSVVFQEGVCKADKILNLLHQYIYKSLQQEQGESSDGMDISVLVIYDSKPIAEYAGAMNPLYYVQDGKFNELKGDSKPIGSNYYGKERNYTKHVIDTSKSTTFYMASDGYQDQFGGIENKKFMKKNFKTLLHEIASKPFSEQKTILSTKLNDWIETGQEHQIDDILIIGTKVER